MFECELCGTKSDHPEHHCIPGPALCLPIGFGTPEEIAADQAAQEDWELRSLLEQEIEASNYHIQVIDGIVQILESKDRIRRR